MQVCLPLVLVEYRAVSYLSCCVHSIFNKNLDGVSIKIIFTGIPIFKPTVLPVQGTPY